MQFSRFSEKNILYVKQLFNDNGSIKKQHEFKQNMIYIRILISMGTANRLYFRKININH